MTRRLRNTLAVMCGLLAGLALATANVAQAITANPALLEVRQPDGTRLPVHMVGDEHASWFEDLQGYVVMQATDGEYRYAIRGTDGDLVPSGYRAGSASPAAAGIPQHLRPTPEALAHAMAVTPPAELAAITPPNGTVKNLVLLAQFSNHGASMIRPPSEYTTLFNQLGSDPVIAPTGSVRNVWLENSYSALDLVSTVQNWVLLPNPETYYSNFNSGNTKQFRDSMVVQTLRALDATVNFGQFDGNNDGYVDAIDVIHSGYGSEVNKNPTRIWSQQWSLGTDWVSNDVNGNGVRVKVQSVHTEPALWDTTGTGIVHIGVIAHETGHFFGLPDLYDYDYDGQGAGLWCLMGDSWGWDKTQHYPPHLSAWCKKQLGYILPLSASTPGVYSLPSAEFSASAVMFQSGFHAGEYLLVENRQPVGYDRQIPQGGLAVWHIDETIPHAPGDPCNQYQGYPGQTGWPFNGFHYAIALLQADGLYDLEKHDWANYVHGDDGDLYHDRPGVALSESTVPNTNAYQQSFGWPTANEISEVSPAQTTMTFRYRPASWVDISYPAGDLHNGSFEFPFSSYASANSALVLDDQIIIFRAATIGGIPGLSRRMRFKSWGGTTTLLP